MRALIDFWLQIQEDHPATQHLVKAQILVCKFELNTDYLHVVEYTARNTDMEVEFLIQVHLNCWNKPYKLYETRQSHVTCWCLQYHFEAPTLTTWTACSSLFFWNQK